MTTTIAQAGVEAGLRLLGARPVSHLMVHASLSSFGRVEGGAAAVVAALRLAAGTEGAVVLPSFRDAIRSDHYALRECQGKCPQPLCPSSERGFTGAIGETLREEPDSVRSCHPTHRWAGVGDGASFLLGGHRDSATPCGRESPFFRLMERDGLVLLLGVGVNSITNIHAVEDIRNLPSLSAIDPPHRHATYTTSGRRIQYRFPDLLQRALSDCGILRTAPIGAATCHSMRARDLGAFLWIVTDDDPWCLVLRPHRNRYDPAADAAEKTRRMAAVWQSRGDTAAWQDLLAAAKGFAGTPVPFSPSAAPLIDCPAYAGVVRGYHRCAANDIPPWERFEDVTPDEPGVATCGTCNWRETRP